MTTNEYADRLRGLAYSYQFACYRGLLLDIAKELARIPVMESELEDYARTVQRLNRETQPKEAA